MRVTLLAALGLALAATPAIADAQQTGQRGQPPDTTAGRQRDTTRAEVRAEARGDVTLSANRGLTEAQVRELQQRLRAAGCDPGAIDGMIGPRTRQAMACARRQEGIESANANEVLRALDLQFTFADSLGGVGAVAAGARSDAGYGDPTFVRDSGVMVIDFDTLPAGLLDTTSVFVPVYVIGRATFLRETSLERRSNVLVPRDSATAARDVTPPARRDTAAREDSAAMRRDTVPPARRDSVAEIHRDTIPALRRDTTPAMRRDSVPAARRDSTPTPSVRPDTTARIRADTTVRTRTDTTVRTRTDTTVRTRADTTVRTRVDTTARRRADSARVTRPDTGRARGDTTRLDPAELQRMRDELLLSLPPRADTLQRPDSTARDTLRTRPDSARTRPDTTRTRPDSTRTPPDTSRRRPPPPR